MAIPPYMHPFVLTVAPAERHRQGNIDVHTARVPAGGPRPVVVFVHGGPLPGDVEPKPRDWPAFLGYGALAVASGVVGVTVDHRLHGITDYSIAAQDVALAVEQARGVDGVDPDRVGLWFFSGGGLLAADWLAAPPLWLRCLAMTYPVLAPPPGWDVEARFDAVAAVSTAPKLPILLTRVGHEYPDFARTQDAFVDTARAKGVALDVIEVPDGQHGFDSLDHTKESRAAVTQAMTWVAAALRER
ncbi:MAG: alpha/beta hydrolase [Actinomycetota bacterium]|nr:alpha/beta hydrolase [Actinomycetota bacterium]